MNFDAMAQYLPLYEDAAWLTLSIGWIGIAGSVIIGLIVAMIVHFRIPVLRQLCRVYIELFRNTPLLIQLFFFYFGLPRMGFSITPEVCGMVGLALHGGAYMAESFRAGLENVEPIQRESAISLGLSKLQSMRYVELPIVCRQRYLPVEGNQRVFRNQPDGPHVRYERPDGPLLQNHRMPGNARSVLPHYPGAGFRCWYVH